jgi:HAD superfamily hydrolase (TIGR01549 family)
VLRSRAYLKGDAILFILFDLDCTIVDSIPGIMAVSRLVCAELNINWDEKLVRSLIGIPLAHSAEIIAGAAKADLFLNSYNKHFQNVNPKKYRAFPGMVDFLSELKEKGAKMAVVSSKRLPGVNAALEDMNLRHVFSALITASDDCAAKPSPEPALLALKKLGRHEEPFYFVGDSPFDMRCGRAAGAITIGVTWGAASEEALKKDNAAYTANNVEDLKRLLLSQYVETCEM